MPPVTIISQVLQSSGCKQAGRIVRALSLFSRSGHAVAVFRMGKYLVCLSRSNFFSMHMHTCAGTGRQLVFISTTFNS